MRLLSTVPIIPSHVNLPYAYANLLGAHWAGLPADHSWRGKVQSSPIVVRAVAVHELHRFPEGRQLLLSFCRASPAAAAAAAADKLPPCLLASSA